MYAGVDIGGTSARVAAFVDSQSDTIQRQEQFEISNNYKEDLERLVAAITSVIGTETCDGIGVGVAGEFDEQAGSLRHSPHLKGWVGQPLRQDLTTALECPITIVNDADAAGLAEATFGGAKEDFWMITWGTGVGSSVIEMRPEGPRAINAEAGHHVIRWDDNSPVCECGRHGCLEAYVGGTSVQKRYGKLITDLEGQDWHEVADWMARGLYNMVRVFPTNRIVLGGGVTEKQVAYLPEIEQMTNTYLKGFRTVRLSHAAHGERAGMVGAMVAVAARQS